MTKTPVVAIIGAGLVLSLPTLLWGFAHRTGDGALQEIWYANFVAQLAQGEIYPRWLAAMNGGLGSPVFFYYPPASFWLTSLFEPLHGGGAYRWHVLGASAALGLVASGLAAYLWLKQATAKEIAAVVAVVYMALPYHLAVDLHFRGALPEFWAFAVMPLILHATIATVDGRARALPWLASSYALLLFTHPPTTLIFSWVPPGYALVLAPRGARLACLGRTVGGMALGAGMAAIYLVPALTTQGDVSMAAMSAGKFDYRNAFFFAHFDRRVGRDALEVLLFWIAAGTAAVGLCTWPLRRGREHVFWTAVLVVAMLMMFPVSTFAYQWVPLLPRIQFPWRFNTVLAVAVCALLPAVLQWLPARLRVVTQLHPHAGWALVALAGVALVAWTLQSYNPIANPPEQPSDERKRLDLDAAEYRPRWSMQDVRTTLADLAVEGQRPAPVAVVEGAGRVDVVRRASRRIVLESRTTGGVVEVRQFYSPVWEASLPDGRTLAIAPSVPAGLIRFTVPEGRHVVTLRLRRSTSEWSGLGLSLVSVVIVVVSLLRRATHRRP